MILNQTNFDVNIRDIFCNSVIRIFGDSNSFLDFIENEEYSDKYDCFFNYSGENYIINRDTGEYINWYKFSHIGRCTNISILSNYNNIHKWIDNFLSEFKESNNK